MFERLSDLRLLDIEHYLDGVITANALAYRKIFDMAQATPNLGEDELLTLGARIRDSRPHPQHKA